MKTTLTIASLVGAAVIGFAAPATAEPDNAIIDQTVQQASRGAATSISPQAEGFQEDFINVAGPSAQAVMAEFRVPASVGTAQSILESNWGRSTLSVNDKNYFGFKCTSPSSPGPIAIGCHRYVTEECTPTCHSVEAYFRVYATMTDSFRDYGRLLSTNSVYAAAFQYVNDPDQFAREIARHYATDPSYADKVIGLMRTWNLYRFNTARAGSSLSGDGRAEFASVQPDGGVRAWYNAAGFAAMPWGGDSVIIATGFAPATTRFADLDGDGKSDILAVQPNGEVRAWRNGVGFGPTPWHGDNVVVATGVTDPARVKFADLDGDRKAEVLSVQPNGEVRAWHNVAGFAPMPWGGDSVIIATGVTDPAAAFFADLDSDGKAEIMTVEANGDVRAWHNVTGFAPTPWRGDSVIIASGFAPAATKFGDLDGDGKAEIMAVLATGEVRAWHNVMGFAALPWRGDNVVVATGVTDPARAFVA